MSMATTEVQQVIKSILLAYPNLAKDHERIDAIGRKMQEFSFKNAMRAVDEYVSMSGDVFFEMTRFYAVCYRIERQASESIAATERARSAAAERAEHERLQRKVSAVDSVIAEMTDDDVRAEWTPILMTMTGKAREWAEKWPMSTVRTNRRFRLHMAMLCNAAPVTGQ